jgi:TP901 family phage tail tape measure protein
MMVAGAALGGALAAGLAATVGPAIQFEQTMSGVGAVSGATAVQMQQLSTLALQLGKDTVFSGQ